MTESRKTVTIVFADVTGSTALGEQTDPEAMRRIMERYFEEMHSAQGEVVAGDASSTQAFVTGDAVKELTASADVVRAELAALQSSGCRPK